MSQLQISTINQDNTQILPNLYESKQNGHLITQFSSSILSYGSTQHSSRQNSKQDSRTSVASKESTNQRRQSDQYQNQSTNNSSFFSDNQNSTNYTVLSSQYNQKQQQNNEIQKQDQILKRIQNNRIKNQQNIQNKANLLNNAKSQLRMTYGKHQQIQRTNEDNEQVVQKQESVNYQEEEVNQYINCQTDELQVESKPVTSANTQQHNHNKNSNDKEMQNTNYTFANQQSDSNEGKHKDELKIQEQIRIKQELLDQEIQNKMSILKNSLCQVQNKQKQQSKAKSEQVIKRISDMRIQQEKNKKIIQNNIIKQTILLSEKTEQQKQIAENYLIQKQEQQKKEQKKFQLNELRRRQIRLSYAHQLNINLSRDLKLPQSNPQSAHINEFKHYQQLQQRRNHNLLTFKLLELTEQLGSVQQNKNDIYKRLLKTKYQTEFSICSTLYILHANLQIQSIQQFKDIISQIIDILQQDIQKVQIYWQQQIILNNPSIQQFECLTNIIIQLKTLTHFCRNIGDLKETINIIILIQQNLPIYYIDPQLDSLLLEEYKKEKLENSLTYENILTELNIEQFPQFQKQISKMNYIKNGIQLFKLTVQNAINFEQFDYCVKKYEQSILRCIFQVPKHLLQYE